MLKVINKNMEAEIENHKYIRKVCCRNKYSGAPF